MATFHFPHNIDSIILRLLHENEMGDDLPGIRGALALEVDNRRALEDAILGINLGLRYATVVVASTDSLNPDAADFVLTSTSDSSTMDAAVAALPAAGGLLLLMDGTFPRVVFNKANSTLAGMGAATIVSATSSTTGVNVTGAKSTVRDLTVNTVSGTGILVNANRVRVLRADVVTTSASFAILQNTGAGLSYCWIEDCYVAAAGRNGGIYVDDLATVIDNFVVGSGSGGFGEGIRADNSARIRGNVVSGHYDGIAVGPKSIVGENTVLSSARHGITATSGDDSEIRGNRVASPAEHGIALFRSSDCLVQGNHVRQAASGKAGIIMLTSSGVGANRNNVQHNTVRSTVAAYGIRVDDSTCADNLVTNNDLKSSGTTPFSDAGTGTITTAGNRT